MPRISCRHGWSSVPHSYPSAACFWAYGADKGYDNSGSLLAVVLILSDKMLWNSDLSLSLSLTDIHTHKDLDISGNCSGYCENILDIGFLGEHNTIGIPS